MSAPSSRHPSSPGPGPPATAFRPSPARAATLSAYSYKGRAASQPAGERIPVPPPAAQPISAQGSPGLNGGALGPYGVIGGSRTPGRFAGALASAGTTTRANSFSAGEIRDPRNSSLTRTLSSHAEELPTRSHSTSPFPTFSPSSSPSTSPATHLQQSLAHSPPKAEANISRSRSQSLAAGVRPGDLRPHMLPMSTVETPGSLQRRFDEGWNLSPPEAGGNMSPFARAVPTFESSGGGGGRNGNSQPPQNRFRPQQDYLRGWGSSAPEANQAALSRSVANALGSAQSHSTYVGGFEHNGGKSGSSSRRHSVSVVGGPGGRRDFLFGELGQGMSAMVSPPSRGIGPLGFSDAELLPEKLGNALSLEIDENRKRGIDIEVKSPKARDISQAASLPHFSPHLPGPQSRSIVFPIRPKDPFAPDLAFGSSPSRGRMDALVTSAERAASGESKSSSARSRFSFDNPHATAAVGSPVVGSSRPNGSSGTTRNMGDSSDIGNPSPDRGRTTSTAGPLGVGLTRGPGAIGAPTAFDLRFVPFQPSQPLAYPRPYGGPPSPTASSYPGPSGGGYPRPPAGFPFYPQGPPQLSNQGRSPMGYPGQAFAPNQPHLPNYPPQGSYFQPPVSPAVPTSPSSFSSLSLADLGKGLQLSSLPPNTPLYVVTFKAGRRDVYYCPDPTLLISNGDRVIVEADRGSDLGTVVYDQLTPFEVRDWQEKQATAALLSGASQHQPPGMAVEPQPTRKPALRVSGGELAGADLHTLLLGVGPSGSQMEMGAAVRGPLAKEIMPKRIFAKSSQGAEEQARMMEKQRDEYEAMMICREKVMQRGLPMQIVDAEYQWDRRKLTFYFKADKRVDFRELTKENFRIFKIHELDENA